MDGKSSLLDSLRPGYQDDPFIFIDDGSWRDDVAGLMFLVFPCIHRSTGNMAGLGTEANRDGIHDSARGKDAAAGVHDDIRPSRNGGMNLDHILGWQQTRGQRIYPSCFGSVTASICGFYGRGRKDGLASRQWIRQSRFKLLLLHIS